MDMIQTFRIMTGIDDREASDFFTMNPRETRGHGKKIMKQPGRLNLRKFSFSHRVVDDWNPSPSKVVEARYLEQFKAELDEAWKDREGGRGGMTVIHIILMAPYIQTNNFI